jgi:hypothetical protein
MQIIQLGQFISGLLDDGYVIERSRDIKELYKADSGKEIPEKEIRKVMRDHLEMRFTKIINVSPQANSDRCRIQR